MYGLIPPDSISWWDKQFYFFLFSRAFMRDKIHSCISASSHATPPRISEESGTGLGKVASKYLDLLFIFRYIQLRLNLVSLITSGSRIKEIFIFFSIIHSASLKEAKSLIDVLDTIAQGRIKKLKGAKALKSKINRF